MVYYDITNQKKELRNLTYSGRKKLIEKCLVEELVEGDDYKVINVAPYGLPKELKSSLHRLLSDNIYDSEKKSTGARRRPVGDSRKDLSRLLGRKYDPNRDTEKRTNTALAKSNHNI